MLGPPCKIAVARRASARGAGTVRSNELLGHIAVPYLPRGRVVIRDAMKKPATKNPTKIAKADRT